jgi:hypothetical protein
MSAPLDAAAALLFSQIVSIQMKLVKGPLREDALSGSVPIPCA